MAEIEIYGDGTKYEGDLQEAPVPEDPSAFAWPSGRPKGTGKATWPDGGIYTGEWVLGVMSGTGTAIDADGAKYEGEWADGKPHGTGKMTWADGISVEGIFTNGIISE